LAAQADIDSVKLNLPTWAAEQTDWDDVKIGTVLDSNGTNLNAATYQFWLQRVSDLTAITDMADAGITRPLSQTYQHAQDMLKYWSALGGPNATSIGKIKKRYHHNRPGYGLAEYGGVYARTD
jgi:hypothetical protein